jgi:hypothetical protein
LQFSSRQSADVVVVAPARRIAHGTAGALECVLTPLLPQSKLPARGRAALDAT